MVLKILQDIYGITTSKLLFALSFRQSQVELREQIDKLAEGEACSLMFFE